MKKLLLIFSAIWCLFGCNKVRYFDGPDFYQDGFEAYSTLNELLLPDDQAWSFTQLTKVENTIEVDTTLVHNGNRSLKFFAKKTDQDGASKASIAKQNMAFWEGETVRLSAWYFIDGSSSLNGCS